MFDWIPLEYYTPIYYNLLLIFVFVTYISSFRIGLSDTLNLHNKNGLGIFLLIFIILYIGFRPISGQYFGDMGAYNLYFERYASGGDLLPDKDYFFHVFMLLSSKVMSAKIFFLVCFLLYIIPLFAASKILFREYWFYALLMFIISFSFWGYAVNGIRNGIATSLFIYAISQKNKMMLFPLLLLSFSFHNSMLLPIVAYILAYFLDRPKWYLIVWFLCIPLSLILGNSLEAFFSSTIESDRTAGYLSETEEIMGKFAHIGFRWDFLIYSAIGVYTGWYFIYKKKFEDKTYNLIYCTYLIANSFWVLVIRAAFSNRFAYLSWFLLAIVIIYPLLKIKFFNNQHQVIGKIIFFYYMFTYTMYILKGN